MKTTNLPPIELTYRAAALRRGEEEFYYVEGVILLPDGGCIRYSDNRLFARRAVAEELARLYLLLGAPPLFLSPLMRAGEDAPPALAHADGTGRPRR